MTDAPETGITHRPDLAFIAERHRAHAKHGAGSMEGLDWRDPKFLPVLMEEVGEVARGLCERSLGNLSDSELREYLAEELTQVGAMTAAWLDAVLRGADNG